MKESVHGPAGGGRCVRWVMSQPGMKATSPRRRGKAMHAAGGQSASGGLMVGRAGRQRRARFRRALPPTVRHDRRRRSRFPARSAGSGDAARRRRSESSRTAASSKWSPRPRRSPKSASADPLGLMRVAWHLGNRHLPTELMPKALRIRRDPVIEEMASGLGARVIALEAPFNPEGGAYVQAEPGAHGHDHHDHDHHDHDAITNQARSVTSHGPSRAWSGLRSSRPSSRPRSRPRSWTRARLRPTRPSCR